MIDVWTWWTWNFLIFRKFQLIGLRSRRLLEYAKEWRYNAKTTKRQHRMGSKQQERKGSSENVTINWSTLKTGHLCTRQPQCWRVITQSLQNKKTTRQDFWVLAGIALSLSNHVNPETSELDCISLLSSIIGVKERERSTHSIVKTESTSNPRLWNNGLHEDSREKKSETMRHFAKWKKIFFAAKSLYHPDTFVHTKNNCEALFRQTWREFHNFPTIFFSLIIIIKWIKNLSPLKKKNT